MKNLSIIVMLILTGCATGSHIVTGKTHPAIIEESVKIYSVRPDNAEIIGTVSASQALGIFGGFTSQRQQNNALRELKRQAGKIGANGVVISQAEWAYFVGATASGTAIFVP